MSLAYEETMGSETKRSLRGRVRWWTRRIRSGPTKKGYDVAFSALSFRIRNQDEPFFGGPLLILLVHHLTLLLRLHLVSLPMEETAR